MPFTVAAFSELRSLRSDLNGHDFTWGGREYHLRLIGEHQKHNAALVLTGIEILRERGWEIPETAVRAGLETVIWPARMEVLSRSPLFILDGGHNPQCAEALTSSLEVLLPNQKVIFLTGVLADKDYRSILRLMLPYAKEFVCVTPDSPRRLTAEALKAYLESQGARATGCDSIEEGVHLALTRAGGDTPVVAFGSLYLAGAVRSSFHSQYRMYLRGRGIQAREAIPVPRREADSARIVERIVETEAFQNARTVFLYEHTRAEASLEELVRHPASRGKRFAYPLCLDEREMEALVPEGMDAWRAGKFGILEPVPELSETVAPEEIDFVICPCSAFDPACNRMGMGEGYYDRYLPKCANAVIAAAAFEAQKADSIPTDAWDRPMDLVFTEDAVYRRV